MNYLLKLSPKGLSTGKVKSAVEKFGTALFALFGALAGSLVAF